MNNASTKAIVEVERGSSSRAVFDEQFRLIGYKEVDAPYPFAYGFILNTSSEDGDGVDCYILTDRDIRVGERVDCVPVGLLEQFENNEVDNKIICVLEDDDFRFEPEHIRRIERFILHIFGKFPEIEIRFGGYKDASHAAEYIRQWMQESEEN